jgi:ketosteroid isomerase-like protein
MSKTNIACAALLALSLGACAKTETAAPAGDAAKIADAVKADAQKLIAELNAKDLDKAVAHDAPDIVGMFHGAPNIKGPDEDRATTKPLLADPAFHLELKDETVDVAKAGDMAVLRATYTATQTDPKTKKVGTETGNLVSVYKQQADGSWKIAQQVISDTPPAGAAAPAPAPAAAPAAAPAKK